MRQHVPIEADKTSASAKLMLVEDDPALRLAIETTLSLKSIAFESFEDGESALVALARGNWFAVVSDIRLPSMTGLDLLMQTRNEYPDLPIILMTAFADAQTAVQALKGGARDFLMKPFKPEQLMEVVKRYITNDSASAGSNEGIVAVDPVSRRLVHMLTRVAQTDASVLLLGESGVGKEVMAQFLHRRSQRNGQAFVPINCAAIPPSLLEATLFGHERGAFTGANKVQPGKFELAQGGTIFLDEIGEMPPELQTKLLRVLQERQVERVGSNQTIHLDVRLVTATNQDLSKRVSEGQFREDLYYRINVFPLKIPPLRERVDDILPLADRFLVKYRASMGQPEAVLSDEARECLRRYAWPGNVRELENAIQRALLLCDGISIRAVDFAIATHEFNDPVAPAQSQMPELTANINEVDKSKSANVRSMEREHILHVLQQVGGNRRRAVQILGISERTLRYKLKSWREDGISIP